MKKFGVIAAPLALLVAAPVLSLGSTEPAQTAVAACQKAPTWTGGQTKFGISLNATSTSNMYDDLQQEERRFGTRIPVVRTFDTGMPRSDAWKQRSAWFGRRMVVTSIKLKPQEVNAGKFDSQLRNYFQTAPTDAPIFWSYYHEPEDEVKRGEFTAEQFRQAFRRIVNIAAASCKSNLYPTLILMGWTAEPASKLDWRDWYPGSDYVSLLAWDPYNGAHGDATYYKSPSVLFDAVVEKSRLAGKPFGIAETGSARVPGDSSGTGRAEWLKKVASYLRWRGAVFATYYQSTRNGDFELRDAPGVSAWRSAMQG
jgi:hypothetical protein